MADPGSDDSGNGGKDEASAPDGVPAASQIREAAKWLIGAFGAVAAIVAAGIQFGDVGKLHDWDLFLAMVGAVLAFVGIAIAVYSIANLLIPRARTVNDLAGAKADDPAVSWLQRNGDLFGAFPGLAELKQARDEDGVRYRGAYQAWRAHPTTHNAARLKAATKLQEPTEEVAKRIVSWANYQTLNADFARALRGRVAAGTVLAAVGLTVFAWKVSEKQPDSHPSSLEGAALAGATLPNVDLSQAVLKKADLSGATLKGANLSETDLSGAKLTGADLTDADLTDATLDATTETTGVKWTGATCPDGTRSADAGGTCAAHLRPKSSDDSGDSTEGISTSPGS